MSVQEMKWATMRILFYSYLGFSLVTVIGGFVTFPIFSRVTFGTWRFWRYIHLSPALYFHGWKMFNLILFSENEGYMMSVPLTSPPMKEPRKDLTLLNPAWDFGSSCGECSQCCTQFQCPVLDKKTGLCRGYDSFFWRFFNCGRFPSAQNEIRFYNCNKWLMKPSGWKTYDEEPAGDLLGGEGPIGATD